MQDLKENQKITPNKLKINNQRFDSETYESSKKDINTSQNDTSNEKIPKKSIDFFPKKMNIEKLDKPLEIYRKYTLENQLIIKDFVPQLKPIEIHVVPSKFRLNKKGFKDLKCNKENKILLNSNNYYISCPNSVEDSDESLNLESSKEILPLKSENKDNSHNKHPASEDEKILDINGTRKFLQKTKNKNIPKIHSKNNFVKKGKYSKDFNLGNSFDSDLSDIDEIDDYSMLIYKNNETKEENNNKEKNNKNKNRTHSFSILEMLQKKFELNDD